MDASLLESRVRRLMIAIVGGTVALAVGLLALAGGAGGPGTSVAHAGAPQPIDHFQCYTGKFVPSPDTVPGDEVSLQDQFGPRNHKVGKPRLFCNPTQKQHGLQTFPIINADNHLTMLKLNARAPKRRLHVLNQFQSANPENPPNLITDPGTNRRPKRPLILVPTQKEGHDEPANLDHFKCYPAKKIRRSKVNASVGLNDQFIPTRSAQVKRAKYLCNPVQKAHDTTTVPITNPQVHLVCYTASKLEIPRAERPKPELNNQFGEWVFTAKVAVILCAPSQKFEVNGG